MNIGIIPARLDSIRFPNKILKNIDGLPMVVRVGKQVQQSNLLDKVIIAVDDSEVYDIVQQHNIEVQMTSTKHQSGTDRVAEVAKQFDNEDVIINIQGDEPLIEPALIDKFVELVDDMSTIGSTHLSMNDLSDRNVVKLCVDKDMYVTDFTRELFSGNTIDKLGGLYKHIGVYGFRQKILMKYTSLEPTKREQLNKLEQIRALDNNIKIKVLITDYDSISVDTPSDLELVKKTLDILNYSS
jgi:3-deoxy-manno-octulosonate cytidylyltransferase (CMP-KDO synthetase)